MRTNPITLLSLVILAMSWGCQDDDDPCDTPRIGEHYTLSAPALDLLSPYAGATRVIFKNNVGDEVPFVIGALQDTIVSYQYLVQCAFDPEQPQSVEGTSQLVSLKLANPAVLPDPLHMTLYEFPRPDTSVALETFSISLSALLSGDYQAGDELFYLVFGTDNTQLTVLDSLVAGGKTFYEVYQPAQITPTPKYAVSYTLTEGIVRIADPATGLTLVYDRTE
jgi:hypothetical protein